MQTYRVVLVIALDADHLSRHEKIITRSQLQRRTEQARRIDKRVAMERAEPHKFRALETPNHPQHPALFRIGHLGLEADHVVEPALAIVLAKLYDCVGPSTVAIAEPDWTHRTKG